MHAAVVWFCGLHAVACRGSAVCTWLHALFLPSLHAIESASFAEFAHSCVQQFCRVCTQLHAPVLAFFPPVPAAACSSSLVPWFAHDCMQRFCSLHMVACTFFCRGCMQLHAPIWQSLHATTYTCSAEFARDRLYLFCRVCMQLNAAVLWSLHTVACTRSAEFAKYCMHLFC